jgi:arginine decarboxylase
LHNYGLDIWADDNFKIDGDEVKVNHLSSPSILKIVQDIRARDIKGPLLLRFPHLIKKQIDNIYKSFNDAKDKLNYKGEFKAVFPLKVNQYPNFLEILLKAGKKYNYGLEAGSKAELLIAMSHISEDAPISLNGFKDKEIVELAFISASMKQDITLTIEGINELEIIIKTIKENPDLSIPSIGLRIKLHSLGVGYWAKSGGINSKFGLTSTELLKAIKLLKDNNLIDKLTTIHFHIGSQITDIVYLKKAIKEAGNIYADLLTLDAISLKAINLGGGLGVEYAMHKTKRSLKYSLEEYANDITFILSSIAKSKDVKEPDIIIESGRYIAASHAMLIAPVFELVSDGYTTEDINLKDKNPPLIDELYELYISIDNHTALEYLHDALDHLNSLMTLFDLGYIDLIDRSNSEVLTHLIIKKSIILLKDKKYEELSDIQNSIAERYLVNFSLFQSLPDFWALNQHFPIMPLSKLSEKPTRSATIWDITCDSDGEIPFDEANPLFLHDIDLKNEEYFLGFFLVGAYQETLGMDHNLFTKPTEATILIDNDAYSIKNLLPSQSIIEILDNLKYDTTKIKDSILKNSKLLKDNGYLKTIKQGN